MGNCFLLEILFNPRIRRIRCDRNDLKRLRIILVGRKLAVNDLHHKIPRHLGHNARRVARNGLQGGVRILQLCAVGLRPVDAGDKRISGRAAIDLAQSIQTLISGCACSKSSQAARETEREPPPSTDWTTSKSG